ncbi:MAG: MraY family glycosyltransferase [bacterium]|nr:MraY family glycosyltransferase [bacterium]
MMYFLVALVAFILSMLATVIIRAIAVRFDITDKPLVERKIHKRPIPLWGGVAIYVGVWVSVILYILYAPLSWPQIIGTHVAGQDIILIAGAGMLLVIGGMLDDVFDLKPWQQIFFPMIAACVIVKGGIGIDQISIPFGGTFFLGAWSDLLTFAWLMVVMYTTKFLDGLDGLVSGMTIINAVIITLLSLFFFVNFPTALLAVIVAGAYAGFLVFNFHPASIFLGEGGSLLAGFFLGILAIVSGAKLATTMLILGIPILDAVWVIIRRMILERRSPFKADRKHIHFRLLDAGLSQRMAVLVLYAFASIFGISALFLQSTQKLIGFGILVLIMILLGWFALHRERQSV